jgi:predicted phosphodiesterase
LRASGYRKEQFDLFVLLGDLATWADQPTYEFLTNYLCANEVQESDSLSTHKVRGLAISQERLIAIPGNHDKMLRRDLSLYFEGFTRRTGLPDAPQPQQCYLVSKTIDDREMLFIQLEASIYGEEALRLDTAAIGLLARGKVTVAARDEIDRKLTALKSGETVDSAEISSYANAWKVLVVHYSPDILATTGKRDPAELVIPHECAGLSELVRELRDDIHVVLHGHLHYPAVYNLHGVPVVSVGTVTQLCREPRKNGFFLLKCFESGEVLTEHHVWHGTGFLQDSNPTLERPLR